MRMKLHSQRLQTCLGKACLQFRSRAFALLRTAIIGERLDHTYDDPVHRDVESGRQQQAARTERKWPSRRWTPSLGWWESVRSTLLRFQEWTIPSGPGRSLPRGTRRMGRGERTGKPFAHHD